MAISLTPAPTLPSLNDPSTFNARALALFSWLTGTHIDELEGITGSDLYATIVGAVSQSGGQPTGAIIERGSNANGSYTKLADGTMFCWGNISSLAFAATTVLGGIYQDAAQPAITFPATFTTAPSLQVNLRGSNNWATVSAVTSSTFTPVFFAASSTSGTQSFYWLAVGRWF
ncbi:hypothetical protein PVT71_14520 [Salipiger sp. H15]|uniref:Putative tail fiber protein gp53-like C-terminal domain-containing protein n=1 Tax=Alloyangia sp. H15 TaxID=3029062 RepID=A0AAU8AMI7_9RHOB